MGKRVAAVGVSGVGECRLRAARQPEAKPAARANWGGEVAKCGLVGPGVQGGYDLAYSTFSGQIRRDAQAPAKGRGTSASLHRTTGRKRRDRVWLRM